jgi:hypothetical protein
MNVPKIIPNLSKMLKKLPTPRKNAPKKQLTKDDLINLESSLGRAVFGATPKNLQREFFYHQNGVWIFHEGYDGQPGATIRYEVHDTGVFKHLPGHHPVKLEKAEMENFLAAARVYLILIEKYLYKNVD